MKIPKTFVPEKCLEKNVEELLSKCLTVPKTHEIDLNRLEIEPGARTKYSDRKNYTSFDKSMKILKKAGYERHLYPWESFELLIKYLEGKLDWRLNAIASDIRASEGNWFSMAVKREDEILICYNDPKNIRLSRYGEKYVVDGELKYTCKEELAIGNIPSQTWIKLQSFNNDFIRFFYNRSFKELPAKIREEPAIYLPPNDLLWPLAGGDRGLSICGYVPERVSRGVRVKR
ncbi:hypothetical protein FJZ53_07405 [Candidatus Woesearchaeota archaeon]|nr:hypothetical protein [Candidatus Woesearchaeota archaeon]